MLVWDGWSTIGQEIVFRSGRDCCIFAPWKRSNLMDLRVRRHSGKGVEGKGE
jgi:hypothetical protein